MLSPETQADVRKQIDKLRLFATHYSRCALTARWRAKREWYWNEVRKFDAMVMSLTLALEFGGAL